MGLSQQSQVETRDKPIDPTWGQKCEHDPGGVVHGVPVVQDDKPEGGLGVDDTSTQVSKEIWLYVWNNLGLELENMALILCSCDRKYKSFWL